MQIGSGQKAEVSWYGGGQRQVELITGTGQWFRTGIGLIEVRWVFVRDLTGTHRDEYLFSTDVTMTPEKIVELYTSRWSVEVTFQECKGHLRVEKTKVWTECSVLTLIPLLFCCYSAVVIMATALMTEIPDIRKSWPGKTHTTFSDMLWLLRRQFWKGYLTDSQQKTRLSQNRKNPDPLLMNALCQCA